MCTDHQQVVITHLGHVTKFHGAVHGDVLTQLITVADDQPPDVVASTLMLRPGTDNAVLANDVANTKRAAAANHRSGVQPAGIADDSASLDHAVGSE